MARLATVNDIIRRVAGELGLGDDAHPMDSPDPKYKQLAALLQGACEEMVQLHPWQILKKIYNRTTSSADSGTYELPSDFSYMIDQTGWELTNRFPIGGPLSSQEWQYLRGLNLTGMTIYVCFRFIENKLEIYPQPVPDGLEITFEYISENFVADNLDLENPSDNITTGSQIVMFDPTLIQRFLKVKYLQAKNMDSSTAENEFDLMFTGRTGRDTGAQVLSAGRYRRFPYLSGWRNTPWTNYGV